MKKLTKVLISVAAAASLCFAAVACGEDDKPVPAQPGNTGTIETPTPPEQPGTPETPVTYTVTYDLNGGSGTLPTESAKASGAKFNLASGDGLTKAEFTFDGWLDDSSTKYAAGAEYTMPEGNVTFTAQWKANEQEQPPETPVTYTVTYELDGGSGTTPTESAKQAGAKFNLASGDGLTKAEFTFDGWNDGTTKYAAGAEYTMPASNVTLTAQWKANEQEQPPEEPEAIYAAYELDYKGTIVLYDNDKGELMYVDSMDHDRTAKFTYTVTGTSIVINIGGSDFTGTFNGELLTINFTYASTLYRFGEFVQEEVVAPTFTFNANGGSGTAPVITESDMKYNENAGVYSVKLPQNTFTAPQGKVFDKWAVDDEKNTYGAGKTFMADPNTSYTVIALWKTVEPEVVVPTGVEFSGNCKTPTKTQAFVGTVGGETIVKLYVDNAELAIYYVLSDGDTVYKAANVGVILDKKWMPDLYGSDAYYYDCKIESVTYNIVVSANMKKLTLCDNDDEPLDNGEFLAEGASTIVPTDKTLADYQGTYTGAISFDGDDYDKAVISGTKLSLQEAEYSPNIFALVEDTTGEKLVAVYTKTVMGNVTTITLTFDSDNSFTIEYLKTTSVGGSTTASGSFTRSSQPQPTTEYTVTFDPNNEGATWTATVQPGEKAAKPTTDPVSADGKTFRYWVDDDGVEYDFNAVVTADITLSASYAWKVTFSAGEGTGEIAPLWIKMWTMGALKSLPAATGLSCEGKTFAGWSDGTDTYQPGESYIGSGNVTLTAVWKANTTEPEKPDPENPDNPTPGEPTGYLKEYVGASSASSDAVVFGYASAADAEAANDAIKLMSSTANAERVFYKATVNRNYSNKLTINIAANVGSVSNPKNAENQDIVIDDDTPNQIVYITNTSYANQFVIVFGKNSDGKRTITITNGDITVTWVEIA